MNSNHEWTRMNRRKERKKGRSGLPLSSVPAVLARIGGQLPLDPFMPSVLV